MMSFMAHVLNLNILDSGIDLRKKNHKYQIVKSGQVLVRILYLILLFLYQND